MKGYRTSWHWPTFLALYRAESLALLRDHRTILLSVVLPMVVLPFFFMATSLGEKGREERIEAGSFDYVVSGSEADYFRRLLASAEPSTAVVGPGVRLKETGAEDPLAALEERRLHLFVETFSVAEVRERIREEAGEEGAPDSGSEGASGDPQAPAEPLPLFRVHFLANWDYSQTALGEIESRLVRARISERGSALERVGIGVSEEQVAAVAEIRDLASAAERTGASLGRYATLFMLLFLLTGGSVVAADSLAGEKERGTLETLLGTAAGRQEIVVSKLAVVFTVAFVILLVQLANLSLYTWLGVLELPAHFELTVSPLTALCLILLFLPLAGLTSAVLLWVSGRARTYKEFQIRFFPVCLIALLPASASVWPGIELRSVIALVPVANLSVAVKEVMAGRFDWPFLAMAWGLSAILTVFLVRAIVRDLDRERLVSSAELDAAELLGGPALFPRHVLGLFAILWVVIFLVAVRGGVLAEIRAQVSFNVIGVFVLGSLLMIRRYRLPFREALALRPVPPITALAVLLGFPSTFLVAIAVARLGRWLLPMPQELIEAFARGLLPESLPLWQLLLFIAVIPGIGEEIAFRGVLLHGLRRRFSPTLLVLVTAAIFGLFHIDLFRFLPTFFLGLVLAVVTLLTGSLFAAMAWHVGNNALAILLVWAGIDATALDPSVYGAAALASALSFFLLWRHRRPYPGLRGSGPSDRNG